MDSQQFRMCARELVDYITQYNEGLRDRFVLPDVSPGYIHQLVPEHPPEEPESWEQMLDDIEPVIMKGVSLLHTSLSPLSPLTYPSNHSFLSLCSKLFIAQFCSVPTKNPLLLEAIVFCMFILALSVRNFK